jgi:hypothetical protein
VLLLGLHQTKWRVPTHQLNRYSRAYIKIHGRFRPKLFPVFCFIPTDFPFSLFLQLQIRSADDVIRRIIHSNDLHTHTHTYTKPESEKKNQSTSENVLPIITRAEKQKKTCAMLPVGSRKCCTYVLHILFLGTPDRNTWRKTHTFHQVPTRPAALSFTPCFLSLSLFFSLVFLSLTKYVSSLFTRPNLQQQHSTCLRLYLYKASGQKHGLWCPACQTLHQRAI